MGETAVGPLPRGDEHEAGEMTSQSQYTVVLDDLEHS